MTAIVSIDKTGRITIPKVMRERLRLDPGSLLEAEVVGDKLVIEPAPSEVRLERRGKRRVIVGTKGFDAARSVIEAREDYLDRLARRPER